ncbi:hypothetical protein ABZ912_38615 [Nonomuraea angiospora]|uniref:hypothetical protein n=1 Tax=Nonomuraea angiospora TaxID=46172 RepID=UPI0034106B50
MSTTARADVHVSYHQIQVREEEGDVPVVDGVPNGLTASVPGAAVILTGIHTGVVDVTVHLTAAPPITAAPPTTATPPATDPGRLPPAAAPPADALPAGARPGDAPLATTTAEGWDEVEEVELISFEGRMRLAGLLGDLPEELPVLTPHGPGRYGMRVHARGRDIDYDGVARVPFEFYLVTVWPIDVGPEARRRLGVGVAEELGLPAKSRDLRERARPLGLPEQEPGRVARAEGEWGSVARVEREPGRVGRVEGEWGSVAREREPGRVGRAEGEWGSVAREREPGRVARARPVPPPTPVRGTALASAHGLRIGNPYQEPDAAPELPGGLVAAVPDLLVIRTLKRQGRVGVHVRWDPVAPRLPVSRWEEVEEIEFVTTTGIMQIEGLHTDGERPPNLTFQGAGRYGLQVHGRARRGERLSNRPGESYLLVIWPVALGSS